MSDSGPAVLRLSPLVQFAVLAAALAVVAAQIAPFVRPAAAPAAAGHAPAREQRVYSLTPKSGSHDELNRLLAEGWRVTQVSNAGAADAAHSATVVLSVLLEHPTSKEQDLSFFTAGTDGANQKLNHIGERMRDGWRITSVNSSAGTDGGGWTYYTVFILER